MKTTPGPSSTPAVFSMRANLIFLAAIFSFIALAGVAKAQQAMPQATGLRPPTQAESDWMDRNMVKTESVLPNKLGLDRINAKRRSMGQAEIQAAVVPLGEESQTSAQANVSAGMNLSSSGLSTAAVGTGTVPSSVDNTTLPSFPPVRTQGSLGSCCAFSTTYYAGTHMLGLARGWNNKNDADNTQKLSPKWTYNLVNGGTDGGSWFTAIMDVMMKLGCPSWADFPYIGSTSPPSNYLGWSTNAAVWRSAIPNRFQQIGSVQAVDTTAGLANLKALLGNGYVLLYATNIYDWQYTTVSDDPSTTADNALVGKKVCWMSSTYGSDLGVGGGHAMTIVG